MEFLDAIAQTFAITRFDAGIWLCILILAWIAYYFLTLHQVFEAAFWAMVWLGIYVLLSVLLLGNTIIGSNGWLFPFGFAVFVVSLAIYLVFILAILFPIHWWLIIAEPTHPTLYTVLYFFTTIFFLIALCATMIYMTDQTYIFKPGTFFVWFRDTTFYLQWVQKSLFYSWVIARQDVIIPLWILLMLYKILLSNIISAAFLSIWYNLKNVGFYRKKEDSTYRVEFHEVTSAHAAWHDDHASHWHDDHASHDDHWHPPWHHH